jgi:hypothetical protein
MNEKRRDCLLIDKLLVVLAMIIFILNFLVFPMILKQKPDNDGTFIGLMLLSISVIRLIDIKNK